MAQIVPATFNAQVAVPNRAALPAENAFSGQGYKNQGPIVNDCNQRLVYKNGEFITERCKFFFLSKFI